MNPNCFSLESTPVEPCPSNPQPTEQGQDVAEKDNSLEIYLNGHTSSPESAVNAEVQETKPCPEQEEPQNPSHPEHTDVQDPTCEEETHQTHGGADGRLQQLPDSEGAVEPQDGERDQKEAENCATQLETEGAKQADGESG